MKYICDVCPAAALEGQQGLRHAVVVGVYEQWIRHILSPKHQAGQNLVMARRTYWPEAEYTVVVKNLPKFDNVTQELYVDVLMQLSEYGFVEAVYYGSKVSNAAIVGLQHYELKPIPEVFSSTDGVIVELKVIPKIKSSLSSEDNGVNGKEQRRRRLSSTSSTLSMSALSLSDSGSSSPPISTSSNEAAHNQENQENITQAVDADENRGKTVGCGPNPSKPLTPRAPLSLKNGSSNKVNFNVSAAVESAKGNRIKYGKDVLLKYSNEKALPQRFKDVLEFPTDIIEEEAKVVDREKLEQDMCVTWQIKESGHHNHNGGFKSTQRAYGDARWNKPVNNNQSASWHNT